MVIKHNKGNKKKVQRQNTYLENIKFYNYFLNFVAYHSFKYVLNKKDFMHFKNCEPVFLFPPFLHNTIGKFGPVFGVQHLPLAH